MTISIEKNPLPPIAESEWQFKLYAGASADIHRHVDDNSRHVTKYKSAFTSLIKYSLEESIFQTGIR